MLVEWMVSNFVWLSRQVSGAVQGLDGWCVCTAYQFGLVWHATGVCVYSYVYDWAFGKYGFQAPPLRQPATHPHQHPRPPKIMEPDRTDSSIEIANFGQAHIGTPSKARSFWMF